MEKSPNHITFKMVLKVFCNVSFDVVFAFNSHLSPSVLDLVKNNM